MTFKASRFGFLSSGVTLADLKADGTIPEVTDVLMMEVMKGSRSGVMVWNSGEGSGSRGLEQAISFCRSPGEIGEKEDRSDTMEVAMGGTESDGGRWEKELLISSTFFSK